MNENLGAQIDIYLSRLNDLVGRGRQLADALARDPSNGSLIAATRAWQEQCGITISQLSGGSKAHWLARKFSEAFLLRSEMGEALEGARPEIADWPFETRLAVAEKVGLIRGGCARLPAVARKYRDNRENGAETTVSERDARLTGQVLNVVMRDLNPGR